MDRSDAHFLAMQIVHEESGRTLSKADFDLCMRIAKKAVNKTKAHHGLVVERTVPPDSIPQDQVFHPYRRMGRSRRNSDNT
jgi:hypothetical protein